MTRFKMYRPKLYVAALFLILTCFNCHIQCSQHTSTYDAKTRYLNSELSRFLNSRSPDARFNHFHSNPVTHPHHHHRPHHHHYHHTTEPFRYTTENLHRLRHRRFPKLDGLLARIESAESTTSAPVKSLWDRAYLNNKYQTTPVYDNIIERNKYLRNGKSIQSDDFLYSFNDKPSDGFDDFYDKIQSETTTKISAPTTTTVKNDGGAGLEEYEDNDDQENPDNIKDYDDQSDIWNDDDDNETNEDEEDETDSDDDESEWQAEEPTEKTTTSGSFTDYKWEHYGTREKVTEMRNRKFQQSDDKKFEINEAVAHIKRMGREGLCSKPLPRIMRVQRDPAKTYAPHCTVLHRCADDTGCCGISRICAPKHTQRVQLYFYSHTLGHSSQVERLTFDNHTECECVDRAVYESRNRTTENEGVSFRSLDNSKEYSGSLSSHSRRDVPEARHPFRPGPMSLSTMHYSHHQNSPEQIKRCRCPSLFEPRMHNGNCKCECDVQNMGCDSMSRGREYFSFKDRLCIQNGQCRTPKCEFGLYIIAKGRCPKKLEKFEAVKRLQPSGYYH